MFLRLGSVPTVVVSSPAMAKEFLKTHELIFANRPPTSGDKYLGYERRDVAFAPYGGYYIPPKTRLFVNVWAIGRDESVWEDPLEFKPEKFIGSSIDVNGHHFELLSFGTGGRRCPGISMGLSAVYLVVAQLIHCFHWNVEGNLDIDEVFGLTLPKKFPIFALPSWRLTTDEPS
ncbi:hypothetical protein SUGI_0958290 [Cryptomeria japonica]|nr:hypothetical protein SUGI_0958290 [Cryptomeria japonica]